MKSQWVDMQNSNLYNQPSDKGGVFFMQNSIMKSLFFKSLRSKQIATFIVVSLTLFVTVISPGLYMKEQKNRSRLYVNGEELNR